MHPAPPCAPRPSQPHAPQAPRVPLRDHRRTRYLRTQLDSILSQTVPPLEIVVCDDCSSDATRDILSEYAARDARVHPHYNPHNLGFVKNFEQAMSLCKGDFIALSDQDDVWEPFHIEHLLDIIGDRDLAAANSEVTDEELVPKGYTLLDSLQFEYLPESRDDWFFFLCHGNAVQGAACLVTKRLARSALPFPPGINMHDHYLALCASRSGGISYSKKCILHYRKYDKSVTDATYGTAQKVLYALKKRSANNFTGPAQDLAAFMERLTDPADRAAAGRALVYLRRMAGRGRLAAFPYFVKNYSRITLSHSKKLFFMRLVKYFVLWR